MALSVFSLGSVGVSLVRPKPRIRLGICTCPDQSGDQVSEPIPAWSIPEAVYHRDGALLYIAYVMLICAAPIPADRWHCSLWP